MVNSLPTGYVICYAFMFSSDFFKINSFKKLFQEYDQIQCHTVLDPDQA